jgi:hypothetical protein
VIGLVAGIAFFTKKILEYRRAKHRMRYRIDDSEQAFARG